MTALCVASAAADVCPTLDQCHDQILASLPRGRAWVTPPGTVRWSFFRVVAEMVRYANERICAAREEFFCPTVFETEDVWLEQYGLPDGCDPWPDLCLKVSEQGGARCDYYAALAARLGWAVECIDGGCGDEAGCGEAGCATPSSERGSATLLIRVRLDESPAYDGALGNGAVAGGLEAGQPRACEPDFTRLRCLMARIAPAHLRIEYVAA